MKKVLSLVLVLTMVLGSFSMAFAAAPNDVVGTEYEDAVERLIQLGVLTGYTDGTFKPENTITRSEFAAAVVRAKGLKAAAEAAQGATAFADVPANNWASGYVNVASKMGFVKGYPNGNFGLNDPITYEQAVTLVVRALGYEPAAMSKGGYPYGYLIVANEIELLDSVKGTQGLPAPRGLVAQLIDNALETPLMVQVSYGDRVEHIVSGSRDGVEEKTLLSELNFTKVTGRVTEINEDKSLIRIGDKSLKVAEGFDFQEALGLKLRAWYNDSDKIILYTKLDTPIFDAVEHDDGGLYLYEEDKTYDLATDKDDKVIATLILDGKTVKASNVEDFNADYAKVVLDSYGDIIWAEGFTLEGNIVVEKLDGNVVESYDYEELSLKNYTIVDKDGKTLAVEDLEKNDIVFYNSASGVKFAVVYNNSESGAIEKVYTDSFKFAGDTYDIVEGAKYLDEEDNLGDLTKDILAQMVDSEEDVTVFFDFSGEIVLVTGAREVEVEASNAFLVAEKTHSYPDQRDNSKLYWTLDVLNSEGKIVKYDITQANVDKYMKAHLNNKEATAEQIKNAWEALIVKDNIVKISLDEDGKVTNVQAYTRLDNSGANYTDEFSVTKSYVKGYKLLSSTLVFRVDGAYEDDNVTTIPKDYGVTTLDKAEEEFGTIEKYVLYVTDKGDVAAIYAVETDADDDTTIYTGLVTDIRYLRGDKKADITIEIAGEEKVYTTTKALADELTEKAIERVEVGNKSGEIEDVLNTVKSKNVTVEKVSIGSRSITAGGKEYRLVDDAKLYNAARTAQINLRDLKEDDVVTLYFNIGSEVNEKFVQYVVKGSQKIAGDFEVDADKSFATISTTDYGRTVTLKVYADVADPFVPRDVEIDDTKISVDVESVTLRNVGAPTVAGNLITFEVRFNEDVYVGDTVKLEAGAITIKGDANKAVDLKVTK